MEPSKSYVFFFHYNKPATQKAGKPQLSVHYKGKCHVVDALDCRVPCYSHINKEQPRLVMKGTAIEIRISNNEALII